MSLKPYYESGGIVIYHGDCREILPIVRGEAVVVSDPPFNIGYKYAGYKDRVTEVAYRDLCLLALRPPSVVIHYPEDMFKISAWLGAIPSKCAAWTYNANTPRQWRMAAWFNIMPDFSLVKQPYKNQKDKRIRALMAAGSQGCNLYDWWNCQQVKNVSAEKVEHPCQMPGEVMRNVVGVTPASLIIDPFMGSGTTLIAAKRQGRTAIGIDIEERYCEVAAKRLLQEDKKTQNLTLFEEAL